SDVALDITRILGCKFHLARFHIEPKRVKYFGITLVHPEQNLVLGNIFQIIHQFRADFGKRGEVFYSAGFYIDALEMEIFITAIVHLVNNESISLPKISLDVAILFRGKPARFATPNRSNKNIQARFPGLQKRNRLPVRRNIVAATDWIAEEITERHLARGFCGRGWSSRRDLAGQGKNQR